MGHIAAHIFVMALLAAATLSRIRDRKPKLTTPVHKFLGVDYAVGKDKTVAYILDHTGKIVGFQKRDTHPHGRN